MKNTPAFARALASALAQIAALEIKPTTQATQRSPISSASTNRLRSIDREPAEVVYRSQCPYVSSESRQRWLS
ncbi:MAG: hypothetical protein ACRCYV_09470 [Aeromonas sp.]